MGKRPDVDVFTHPRIFSIAPRLDCAVFALAVACVFSIMGVPAAGAQGPGVGSAGNQARESNGGGGERELQLPEIPVERYRLANGLTVLLARDTGAAVVTVNVWYHVGSGSERPGRTGLAHLFEHLMFEGSQHVGPGEHFRLVEAAGGSLNASANLDRTNFHNTVPAVFLEQLLWLESDRMGFLPAALNEESLRRQREVVRTERRERIENPPFGYQHIVISAALYPPGHPYSWATAGATEDLDAITVDDARDFFHTWYVPGNATLAIVGDFDSAETRRLVDRYFGTLPGGAAPRQPEINPVRLHEEKRIVLEHARAPLPRITMVWPTVGVKHPDLVALSALTRLLSGDRTSRLTRVLVHERQLATQVNAYQGSDEHAGELYIYVTPRPGASLAVIEGVVDSVLAAIATDQPPSAQELQRYRNEVAVRAVTGLQSSLARSEAILEGQVFHGNPHHYRERMIATREVTAADIQRVVREYLRGGRVVLSMIPEGRFELISKPELPYVNATPPGGGQ